MFLFVTQIFPPKGKYCCIPMEQLLHPNATNFPPQWNKFYLSKGIFPGIITLPCKT